MLVGWAVVAGFETPASAKELELEVRLLVWKNVPAKVPFIPEREQILPGSQGLAAGRPGLPSGLILRLGDLPKDAESYACITTGVDLERPFCVTAQMGRNRVSVSGTLTKATRNAYHLEFTPELVRFANEGQKTQRVHTTVEFELGQWYVIGGLAQHLVSDRGHNDFQKEARSIGFAARVIDRKKEGKANTTAEAESYGDLP
jgi:hypothetical protein